LVSLAALGAAAPLVIGAVAVGAALAPNLLSEWMSKKRQEREDAIQVHYNDVISRMMARVLAESVRALTFDKIPGASESNKKIKEIWISKLETASKADEPGKTLRQEIFAYNRPQDQRDDATQLFAGIDDQNVVQARVWSMLWPPLARWAGQLLPAESHSTAGNVLRDQFFDSFQDRVYQELSKQENHALRTKLAMNAQHLSLQLSVTHLELTKQVATEIGSLRNALLQPSLEFPIYQVAAELDRRLEVSSLKYTLRLVENLVGPADAWFALQDFALHPDTCRWAILTGPAGSGKSRLALELGLWLRQYEWHVGFLKGELPADLKLVQKPLLLIVDYCASKAASLHILLRRLSQRTGGQPVRVLLLERYYHPDAQWARELISQDPGVIQTWSGNEIAVPALESDEMLSVFKRAYRALTEREPGTELATRAKEIFEEDRFSRRLRPIYATAAALIAARNSNTFHQLHGDQLIDTMLREEETLWRQRRASEADAHAVFVSTWAGQRGAEFDTITRKIDCMQTGRKAEIASFVAGVPDFSRAMQLVGVEGGSEGQLAPIEPDLIGEGFVVSRLAGEFQCDRTAAEIRKESEHLLRCLLNEQQCEEATLGLTIQDYIHRPGFRDFILREEVLRKLPPSALSKLATFAWRAGDDAPLVLAALDRIGFEDLTATAVGSSLGAADEEFETTDAVSVENRDELITAAERAFLLGLSRYVNVLAAEDLKAAETFFRQALELLRPLRATFPDEDKAENLDRLTLGHLGRVRFARGGIMEALGYFERELQIAKSRRSRNLPNSRRDLSVSLNNVADILQARGDLSGAIENYEESLTIRRELARELGTSGSRRDVSVSLDNVADILKARGDLSGALENYEESLTIRRELARELGTPESRRDVSVSLNNVAGILQARGDLSGALVNCEESLTIDRELARELGTPESRRDVSVSLYNVAGILQARGDLSGALENYEESLTIRRELARELGTPGSRRDVSVSLTNVARIHEVRGDLSGALENYEECVRIFSELAKELGTPESRRDVSVSMNDVADILKTRGDLSGALENYEECVRIFREFAEELGTPESRRDVSISLNNVAGILEARGDLSGALEKYEESLSIARELAQELGTPQGWRDLAVLLALLALVKGPTNPQAACDHLREARTINEKLVTQFPDIVQFTEDQEGLAQVWAQFGCQDA